MLKSSLQCQETPIYLIRENFKSLLTFSKQNIQKILSHHQNSKEVGLPIFLKIVSQGKKTFLCVSAMASSSEIINENSSSEKRQDYLPVSTFIFFCLIF